MILGLGLNLVLAVAGFWSCAVRLERRGTSTGRVTAYGSIIWAIMFLHTLDVVADLVFTLVLLVIVVAIGNHGTEAAARRPRR